MTVQTMNKTCVGCCAAFVPVDGSPSGDSLCTDCEKVFYPENNGGKPPKSVIEQRNRLRIGPTCNLPRPADADAYQLAVTMGDELDGCGSVDSAIDAMVACVMQMRDASLMLMRKAKDCDIAMQAEPKQ